MKRLFLILLIIATCMGACPVGFLSNRAWGQTDSIAQKNTQPLQVHYGKIPLQNKPLVFKQAAPVPKPFFCRMEDNLYRQFNFSIILRAGSDEQYRKMKLPI